MIIARVSKEEQALMIHALEWAIDKLNIEKEKYYPVEHRDSFEVVISKYREMSEMIKNAPIMG